ncbi:hypothetical protein F4801DRAFT_596452 [Xylaria longipes]|nr:hypothetical protein F4801DRAFT_596452 [Xylaria longipes]RYC56582.1 hypothetical protein CHU98_g9623 [Xylaria longipes]
MASTKGQWNTNPQPRQRAPANPTPTPHWQLGDIAFLKWADSFSQSERTELLESRRVHAAATGHPVIILARSNDSRYYIVTTVSAYSSGEYNNYLPPWKQNAHERKHIDGFRAFEGSARPNNKFEPLRLADDKQWPKVETSWVYIHHPCLVPATTLINYTKSRSQLRMEPTSLQDLLGHMEAKCWKFREQKAEIMAKRTPKQPAAKNLQKNWRRDNKENVWGPIESPHINAASEKPKLTDITNAAGNKPLWSTVAAKSTNIAARMVSQPKGQSCSRAPGSQFAVLA